MDYLVIGATAFVASGLTLFSGFGLGTVLLPAFALFFPAPLAVAATGAVHLVNSLFKAALLGADADWRMVARFGLPAVPAAIAGAWLLAGLEATRPLFTWTAFGRDFGPAPAGLAIGLFMIVFAALELQPWFQKLAVPAKYAPLGGIASGFLGGLAGQQGALRSMFLLKSGMLPAQFVATGALIAAIIDLSRMPTYAARFSSDIIGEARDEIGLIATGVACALAGALGGARLVRKVTIGSLRAIVAAMMILIGAAIAAGVIGG
ncbi:sulfite exporter TauE/SafE family protein [Amphiplicatus metriothermophilus]|uniref:Probable membrane transporter protein n=1 Tax=Amphiplicatus metriothermophilus TaxID=1519374 RepID=A0A239Q0R6_9PROT|nr:sulfite exporter TauE/SafE family protein [Amphiplicatus metriothermophilus]MBB5520046.1 hypothetical protein [Amphiplicatus metriothermophilus]SNT75816.1 hypothetical protein SAMN06297382_2918 [Amphiplicatus metriothermophilus]